jgi:hypothetical protein
MDVASAHARSSWSSSMHAYRFMHAERFIHAMQMLLMRVWVRRAYGKK